MATHSATRALHKTLTANEVDTATLTLPQWVSVEVVNHSTTDRIFFTVDGNDPTIEGDNTFVVPPYSAYTINDVSVATPSTVKLISAGAAAYSVIGHPEGA